MAVTDSYAVSDNIKILKDIPYGESQKQKLDVYMPVDAKNAPVIFMVHGGAWRLGDKEAKAVVRNKVDHWVNKGFVFISVNYRLLPEAHPLKQAADVEAALIFSQKEIDKWGGAPDKFILMGHSAGAHLVSLVSSDLNAAREKRIEPWLGVISLDSAVYDVVQVMSARRPPRFYKNAFGEKMAYWKKASPIYQLSEKTPPFLAVCALPRKDDSCSQARSYIEKSKSLGTDAQLLEVDYSHKKVNSELGKDACYTQSVDEFLRRLHPDINSMLSSQSARTRKNCG
ncbi:alpha/beta hydrolase [Marinobacter sp. F3R11]|nr:alpha/beta hydrolase [Marinobacter sp. F3R11]